jgi:hypothetical protein
MVERVRIQTRAPRGTDPGAIEEGWYFIEDGSVVLSTEKGIPIDRHRFTRKVRAGEDARAVAAVMLRSWKKPKSGDFNRQIRYPRVGY